MNALGIAATGMLAQQTQVDVVAHNIANANTTGFKAGRAAFQDLIYQTQRREGALTGEDGAARPVGVDIGLGVQTAGIIRLNTQGGLLETGNQLDLAIDGRGYFVVTRPDGSAAYTRSGAFNLSPEGEVVSLQGDRLEPPLVIPENTTRVEISVDGQVMAYVGNEIAPQLLGRIELATFVNEAGLKPIGDNLMLESAASGAPVDVEPGVEGMGVLRQGYLERSNVDVIKQITDLITAQRAYEMNSKTLTTADQMLQTANQIR
ncbi:flagellar basal-body rod protein FlgG [Marivita sp.]|uniref:flagellar basal-body rod protein FlgG n=1 Tax=Marivita sp. TaxID=2003365 RepID=UPI0025C64C41|nr:flagellar basal-body rod protein FlgG [Marivita sp.]